MKTEIGEYVVGAYLQVIDHCEIVSYNVRPQTSGIEGLPEFDVVGFNYLTQTAFLCEVTTHLNGVKYGTNQQTLKKIEEKA